MPDLDIRTLSFMAMLSSLLLTLGLQIVSRIIIRNTALRLWAMGATAFSTGFILLALRGLIPDLLSIVLANTLLVLGATWHYLGNREFRGHQGKSSWCWWLVAGTAVLFIHFTYLTPHLSARIVLISAVLAAIRFASARVLLHPAGGEDSSVRWFVATAYLLAATFLGIRAVANLFVGPSNQDFMATVSLIQTFAFVLEITLNLALGIGLPMLVLGKTYHQLNASERRFRTLTEWSPTPLGVHDGSKLLYVNPAATRLAGANTAHDLLDKPIQALIHPDHRQQVMSLMQTPSKPGEARPMIETRFLKQDGSIIDAELHSISITYDGKQATQFAINDITEHKQMEKRVRQLAFHDPLTNLANRRLFTDRLSQSMIASKRSTQLGALIFIDLDNFKTLNDAYGHEAGDFLLLEVASRLHQSVRGVDTVARFGGDEFVVIANELETDRQKSAEKAGLIAEKIRAALAVPYTLTIQHGEASQTLEYACSASIGLVLFDGLEADQDIILKAADLAMYQAKQSGGNQVCIVPGND